MPNKAFLKKKSFLDDFRDNQEGTGYIQSARAERTWNNPITRGKRTKKLNTWIKSFDGKRHIHKLARFNRMQTGRDESYEDVKLDCLRYGGVLELPNGVCVKVNAKIRCPRMAAFVFRITGIYDAEPENPSKYVIRGFYPVYGPERKPSKEFDIPCNDVSDIEQWIKSNEKGNRMQHENLEEAMSLTKFTDVVTDKLIKQYDVDEDDVLGYVESHSQELQELLDDKELSLKEKVLFLREEITGVKNEGYGGTKSVMSIWGNRPRDVYPEVSYSSVNDMYNTLLKYGYGDMHPIYYKNNSPEQIKGHILGYFKWTPTNSNADIEADALAAATMIKNNFNKSESNKHEGFVGKWQSKIMQGLEAIKDKYGFDIESDEITDPRHGVTTVYDIIACNNDLTQSLAHVGPEYFHTYTDADFVYSKPYTRKDYTALEAISKLTKVIKDFYSQNPTMARSEAVESTDEKLGYEKGHKNSKGEDAPWVIRSHEDNRILASFAKKKDAEEHMKRMKQYSKSESKKPTNEMVGNKKWVIRIKRLGKNYYVRSSYFTVNKAFRYPSLGGPFVCSDWDITERDIAKYDSYDDAKKSWDSMAQVRRGGLPFYKEGEDYEIVQVNFSMMGESKKSEAINMNGFKNMLRTYNAKGGSVKNGPWRICDGAYDLWFELYYNETPILGCTDNICKWYSNPETVGMTLDDYKKIEDAISSEIFAIDFFKMPESKQSERQGYAPYYFCRSKYTGGELAVLADGDSIHYLPSYNIKGFKDTIDYGTIATSFEPIENPETSELHKIVQRKDGRNIIALTQAEFDDFAENNGWSGRDKWFKDILRNRHIIESIDTRERAVDDYDTMRDGLEAMGFELDSDVRNGKVYPYRRVSKATKDGITYTFMIESDKDYTTSIVVYGGKFNRNDPDDPDGTRFSNVKEVLDAMKTIEESKKSESLINKNEMEAIAEAEESRILDAVQKAAKEAGVDDRLKVSSDKVLVKATLPIDNHDIGEITWVIDGVNGKLTEYVDGEKGYSKKFKDEGPLKDELRICFAAVKDVAGIPEFKKTEAVHFEYTDTIRVPQWLWTAYQTGETHDLNEDELEIFDKFKEEYGSKYHMDDKSEDPYFSSRNDFDNLGGNVYDVDLYVEKPVGNKSTEALSTNLEHPFSFKFKFDSPRVTYAMRDEADSGKYDAKLTVIDNDATDVELFTDSPKAVLKLLDGVAERYNDTYKGMLTRDDLENHFTEAIALVKDVDDDLAAKYFVAFNGKESDGLVVSGELDNVVSFLEAVK